MVGQARGASAYRDGTGKVNLTDPNRKQQIKYGHEHFQISSTDSILYVRSFIAIGWDCMIAKRILVLILHKPSHAVRKKYSPQNLQYLTYFYDLF